MSERTLYNYFRSSTSYRTRIALELKGLDYTYAPIHLVAGGGEQYGEAYRSLNPMSEVPSLQVIRPDGSAFVVAQSVAILEYLEECHPEPPLLPAGPEERARVRQLVEVINSSIHPLQNLKVLKELGRRFGADEEATAAWARDWIARGFDGLERLLGGTAGELAFGDRVTLADVAIVPQVFNARRFGLDLGPYPTIVRVAERADSLPAFRRAAPDNQPDSA